MYDVILPDAGEGTVESEIVAWFFEVGDEIKEDDVLLEMQSDKAVVELPSPKSGILKKKHYDVGELAQVGEPVATIELEGSDGGSTEEKEETAEVLVAEEKTAEEETDATVASTKSAGTGSKNKEVSDDWRTLAVPRVRIYARNNNVDLTQVEGTGNHGKVTIEDIDRFMESPEAQKTEAVKEEKTMSQDEERSNVSMPKSDVKPYQPSESEGAKADRVEKITPMRRAISQAMVNSKMTSPHVTVFDKVEVSALVDHRNEMKVIAGNNDIRLTYTAYFVKALVAVLKRFPELNASMNLDKGEIYYHQYYNVGVAANTPQGLVVPVIKDAERLSLFEIASKVDELAAKANEGKLTQDEMSNGSMTVTNVGGAATGGVWSTPIINQPEVAIVGMGRIENEFLPDEEGNPVLKPVLKISFAFDHRVVDGVYAQEAINLLKEYLNNPNLLLSEG
ncbi:dihydrolipoamide acetyltransferase family protein [Alkalibacterium kapii]|uniref:Dihydrolipoamide acetyltransferase component of pyruvate dehydrogenase complex n=1 Tax=Alkalibacterium kapii TaxID=426704 RepID=A0A511ASG4_9LACT|nr:dihydrolipoamide acetyltransferase family protein [Alkalibacterium kapii]GEK91140.1 dihydrolipoamide acetyltransferase component of pyruvate dehydrogenase complex [Alkalibacterium kapii]